MPGLSESWRGGTGCPVASWATYPVWRGSVSLPSTATFEYKYV